MVYQWKSGGFHVPARVAAERIEQLRAGGDVTPARIVADARPVGSVLHACFCWDDADAAERFRQLQAQRMLRSIVEVHREIDPDTGPRVVQRYVAVGDRENGSRYTVASRALSDAEMRDRVLTDAVRQLRAWRQRFGHLVELADIFRVVDDVAEQEVA